MRILLPFTSRHPHTVAAAPKDANWVKVAGGKNKYFEVLAEYWDPTDDLMVLEHDVVCREDVLEGFASCPEMICKHGYADICHEKCMEAWRDHLGCTRFRKEVIAAVPDAVTSIPERLRHWTVLCDGLGANLRAAGYGHHFHFPPVVHHHMDLRGIVV